MIPTAVAAAIAFLAVTGLVLVVMDNRRLRAEVSAGKIEADCLRRLLRRRGCRVDKGHEQPPGPFGPRLHEPPRHG